MAKQSVPDLKERARHVLPSGSIGNLDIGIIIAGGRGSRVWDSDGNEFIDYLLGSGPMILGHAHPEVLEAVERQIKNGTTFFVTNPHAIELAEMIVEAVNCADQVRFTSTGTEATLYAMRLARAYRKRDKILKFEGGFHGMNDYALMSMAPKVTSNFPQPVPDSAGIPRSVQSDILIAPFNDTAVTTSLIEEYREELAGVIVEPFQRLMPPAPGFLETLRLTTEKYGIPLIFDEIVTGFRFAYGGAQEYYKVTPDLCTLGKIIGGGFPLAAVVGKRHIMNAFEKRESADGGVLQIGTLNGNPVAAAAGVATLKILRKPGTYTRLFDRGRQLMRRFTDILAAKSVDARIVGDFPLFDVFFTASPVVDYRSGVRANQSSLDTMNNVLLEQGVLKGDTKFYMSLAHTDEDIDRTIHAFSTAIDTIGETQFSARRAS